MSWDIFVQDLPDGARSVADIPDDFRPQSVGSRDRIIGVIRQVVPTVDFSDPTWGVVDGPDFSIEINIGPEDPVRSFAFHVRGGDAAAGVVADILQTLDLQALDPASESGLFEPAAARDSLRLWRSYRDKVIGDT